MQVPLQITYNNMGKSEALETAIRKRVDKLVRKYAQIISCHVVVDAPLQSQRKGGLYRVRVDINCPEGKVAVNREPPAKRQAHGDVYVALRDAFNAADRQLDQYSCRRRGQVKTHEETPYGQISYLSPMEDYGKITSPDNREIYFHRNSVLNADFDSLTIGTRVRFTEVAGDKGPQASSVRIVD